LKDFQKLPSGFITMVTSFTSSPSRQLARYAILQGAAVCELENGCIMGPNTSLKKSGYISGMIAAPLSVKLNIPALKAGSFS
jgi:hypothetical protein